MRQIKLNNTLPDVFAGREDTGSDIWLREVTFERGCHYLITAESGTGKSSLCSYLYGYRDDYSGTITFDGEPVRPFDIARWCALRRRHLAYLPQEMRLFHELTVLENIDIKNRLTRHKTAAQVMAMLDTLGIGDKAHTAVAQLSGGQQQRVAVARALCQPFDFIILDEPVSHLDAVNNSIVARLVTAEARACGAGVIATSVGNHLLIDADRVFNL